MWGTTGQDKQGAMFTLVCTCGWMQGEAKGQPQVSFLSICPSLFVARQGFSGTWGSPVRLAGSITNLRDALPPPPQDSATMSGFFTWVLGTKVRWSLHVSSSQPQRALILY